MKFQGTFHLDLTGKEARSVIINRYGKVFLYEDHMLAEDETPPGNFQLVDFEIAPSNGEDESIVSGSVTVVKNSQGEEHYDEIAKSVSGAAPPLQRKLPCVFVPLAFAQDEGKDKVAATPGHSGRTLTDNGDELLSGEICCEFETITPLMVGNCHYRADQIENTEKADRDGWIKVPQSWGPLGVLEGGERIIPGGKTIVEPLFLNTDRSVENNPVIISATSMKGMVRHSMSALLSAPLERVNENFYSYRPNLVNITGQNAKVLHKLALVISCDLNANKLALREVQTNKSTRYVKRKHEQSVVLDNFERCYDEHLQTESLQHIENGNSRRAYVYKGGIDGAGMLHWRGQTAGADNNESISHVIVSENDIGSEELQVSETIVHQYKETQRELADTVCGHLSSRHPGVSDGRYRPSQAVDQLPTGTENYLSVQDISSEILANTQLVPGQIVHIEVENPGAGDQRNQNKVLSVGHHYYYRWRYADSVRTRLSADGLTREIRPELDLASEVYDEGNYQLAGARSLFGFAQDADTLEATASEDLAAGASPVTGARGLKHPLQMAGRIAFNHAIEVGPDDDLKTRFVRYYDQQTGEKHEDCFSVPLNISGQPRPSAEFFYLLPVDRQAANDDVISYGFYPGEQISNSRLAGRKFYRGQAVDEKTNAPFQAWNKEVECSEQASIARYMVQSSRRFRFKVRFRSLTKKELALLALCLNPELYRSGDSTLVGNKLGMGRPFGLGSIRTSLDRTMLFQADLTEQRLEDSDLAKWIDDLVSGDTLNKEVLRAWLGAMQMSFDRQYRHPTLEEFNSIRTRQLKSRRSRENVAQFSASSYQTMVDPSEH